MDHPTEETLKRFAACMATRREGRAVVAHLLRGCAVCAGKLRSSMEPAAVPGPAYEGALNRFDRGLLEALEESIRPVRMVRDLPNEEARPAEPEVALPSRPRR